MRIIKRDRLKNEVLETEAAMLEIHTIEKQIVGLGAGEDCENYEGIGSSDTREKNRSKG